MDFQSSCYMHERSTNTWKLHANMSTKRTEFSSAMVKDRLWISGGYYDTNEHASTEFIFSNGTIINGPNMPAIRYSHCMVTLHDGKVMILGGYPGTAG